jgi:DNA (cytosine-5)-methyltransferase 1
MLLQGFSRKFILEGNLSEQVEQVSNAVPPPLAKSIASSIKTAMKGH